MNSGIPVVEYKRVSNPRPQPPPPQKQPAIEEKKKTKAIAMATPAARPRPSEPLTIYLEINVVIGGLKGFRDAVVRECADRGIKLVPVQKPQGASIICRIGMSTSGRVEWVPELDRMQNMNPQGRYMNVLVWLVKNNDPDPSYKAAIPRGIDANTGVDAEALYKELYDGNPPLRMYTQHFHYETGVYPADGWAFNKEQIILFATDIASLFVQK